MSVAAIAAALGVSAADLAFLAVHTDAERAVLMAAIEGALRPPSFDPLAIAALLTGPDPAGWAEGLAQLHGANDPALWAEITGDCALTDRGKFVSERYQITYGLFQAFCEDPFTPPGEIRFDLSTTNSALFEHLPQAERLAGLAPLAKAASLRLDLWCSKIDDISALAALPNLTRLRLYGCEKITDFSVLGQLTGLRTLDLGNLKGMKDASFLAALTGLRTLKLYNAPALTSLSVLSSHPELQTLSLSHCNGLTDLDGLQASAGLEVVEIDECDALAELSGLSRCAGLRTLRVARCRRVNDLRALAPCAALNEVHVSNCDLSSLDGLQDKPALATVYLDYSVGALRSLDGLSGCSGLTKLHMDGLGRASFSDLNALSAASGLVDLSISGATRLADISGLAGKAALTSLDLRQSAIADVDALADCHALQTVYLSRCGKLQSIAGLAGKAALTALHLRGASRLFDITGLETLTALERLDVSLVGRSRRPTDPCTLAVRPDNDDMTDRASVQAYQDKVALVYAIQSGDRAEVERHVDRTHLNLYGCKMLTNPGLLQLLTNLESLDLRWCEGLPFKVWRKNYDTPEKVAAFFERLAKRLPL